MRRLALVKLQIVDTDKLIFQRRDGQAPTSPHRLGFFGGHMEAGEGPEEAIRREIEEETSLDSRLLELGSLSTYDVPMRRSSPKTPTRIHLFEAMLDAGHAGFDVFEGSGSETYSAEEALARNDIAATVRFLLEQTLS